MNNKVGVTNGELDESTSVAIVTEKNPEQTQKKSSLVDANSLTYKLWEGLVALTCLLSTFFVTFQLAFHSNILRLTVLTYLFDFIYAIHIATKFYTPYIHEGSLVTEPRRIKRRYVSTVFVIDLLSILPIELISLAAHGSIDNNWQYVTRIEKINRILRFYALLRFLGKHEENLSFDTRIVRSLRYSVVIFTLMHFMSCGWYMLTCPNHSETEENTIQCYPHNWASKASKQSMESLSFFERYIKCFYWACITATSTGYGDIAATTSSEKWFSIISMLGGIGFFFGPILGYMASTITNTDSKRARYTHRIGVIKEHLVNKSICQDTQKKINGFYEHLWNRHNGIVSYDMFYELPVTFQSEISLVLNKHIIEKAPLFKDVSDEFVRMISLVIKPKMYLPSQIVVRKDEIRSTLFYIAKGTVEILSDIDSSSVLKVLNEGSFFGEPALLLNIPRATTVRTSAYCELFTLDRSDLRRILYHYPKVNKQLYKTLDSRCQDAETHIKKREETGDSTARYTKLFISEKAGISYTDYVEGEEIVVRDGRSVSISLARRKYVFNPESKFIAAWNFIFGVILVLFTFTHTFVAAYMTSFGKSGYGPWFGFLYFIDGMYYIDFIIYARTTMKDENGHTGLLFDRYRKTNRFWVDLISVAPIELPFLVISDARVRWVTITFIRSNRLLKFHHVFGLLKKLESNISVNIAKVRTIKLALLICCVCHVCACIWFFQACFGNSCAENTWAKHANYSVSTPLSEIYITTMYWSAATMTSTGYGDIHAYATREEFIATIVFIIGLLLFGYCLSNIAAILTNKLHPKVEFMSRINAVVSFIREQKLSGLLIGRVEQYLNLVWRTHRGEAIPGSQLLMGDMPTKLQLELSFEEMQEIISRVPIFKNTDEYFIKLVASKLITYVLAPGDMVVYRGDVGREMYIIRRGLAEVLSKDQDRVLATLGPGGYFGEVGLIFGQSRTADVRTKTYCEVAMLKKSDLDKILKEFPLLESQFCLTSKNKHILEKIKQASVDSEGATGAFFKQGNVKRIEMIEKTKERRSKSIFQHNRKKSCKLNEEEKLIDMELNDEFSKPYKALHPVLQYMSRLLLKKVIHPNGTFFHTWTLISVLVSCLYYITIGLQFAFLEDDKILRLFNYLIDVFFLVDIYIKLHVGFYTEHGVLITHPTVTATHYLKTNFVVDFLAFAPFDVLVLPFSAEVYPYMKLNRLLHILRVGQYFKYLGEPISSSHSLYQGLEFIIYTYLIIHVFACSWFKIACPIKDEYEYPSNGSYRYCLPDSWALQGNVNLSKVPPSRQYIVSLYWAAATACSVGYGDIRAYRVNEKALSWVCMICGVVYFGYIIASLTASLANADAQRARYKSKLDTVDRLLTEQSVTENLSKRVKDFYQFLWIRNKGVDLKTLFEGLPNSLQADITLSLYKDIIESVPLFQGTELGFTKMLSLYIKPLLLPKGEYIVRKGDLGEEMYFIHKGIVEVVSEHATPIVFDTMSPGRFFGEISTIFSCPRTASVRSQTNTDLFVLKKKDLDVVLGHYPHIRKHIIETAEERQRLVQERAKAAAAKKAEEDRQKAQLLIAAMRRFSIAATERQSVSAINETGGMAPTNLLDYNPDGESGESIDLTGDDTRCCQVVKAKLEDMYQYVITKLSFTIPLDTKLHWWRKINCVLIMLNFLTTTYMATFQDHVLAFFIFNIIVEISCYIEIFLKFKMAYLNEHGDPVTDSKEIAMNYLKGEFPFDIVVNFPLWMFSFATNDWQKYYSYFQLLQILRIKRVDDYFQSSLSKLDVNVLVVRLSENVTQIIVILQLSACVWYLIACGGGACSTESWVTVLQIKEKTNPTPFEKYTDSVYWALATMTSTGYGDIVATKTNNGEMIFAAIIMVLGKITFGFVLGNVASTMANMESYRIAFQERFLAVLDHMKSKEMPKALRTRVMNFYQYIWSRNKGSKNDGIFDDLPDCLHAEVCLDLTGELMKEVPMFAGCDLPFIRALSTKSTLVQFHKSEWIYRKGDIGNEMYFIKNGEVSVITEEGFVKVYTQGDYFGEESLVQHAPRISTVRAITHVDMFCLTDADLQEVFQSYPEESVRVRTNIGEASRRNSYMGSEFK